MDTGMFIDRRSLGDHEVGYLLKKYRLEVTPTHKGKKQEAARLLAIEGRPIARIKLSVVDLPDGRKYRDDRLKDVAAGTVIKEMNLIGSVFNHAKSEWDGFRALQDVNLKHSTISLRETKNGTARVVPMSSRTRAIIGEQINGKKPPAS